jgi:hypothetical protein
MPSSLAVFLSLRILDSLAASYSAFSGSLHEKSAADLCERLYVGAVEVGKLQNRKVDAGVVEVFR